jgi:hypothetical protein
VIGAAWERGAQDAVESRRAPRTCLRQAGSALRYRWLLRLGSTIEGRRRIGIRNWLKTIEIMQAINKLDKEALNMYTAPRTYGWLDPGAASPGRFTRGWQIKKQ